MKIERRKNVKKDEDRCRERKGEDIKKKRERKRDIKRERRMDVKQLIRDRGRYRKRIKSQKVVST